MTDSSMAGEGELSNDTSSHSINTSNISNDHNRQSEMRRNVGMGIIDNIVSNA